MRDAADIFDVVIVGGGPVGACLAALLARAYAGGPQAFRVAVLEPRRPQLPAPDAPMDAPRDGRVVALSRASEHLLTTVGAWSRIPAQRISPYERMRVWHESVSPQSNQVLVFDAAEAGEPNLGYIVENRLLQAALLDAATEANVQIVAGELKSLKVGDEYVEIDTSAGSLRARLIVGADGANSAVRSAVGITAQVSPYRQTAIVATVATTRSHEHTAWQRFLKSGTLAFLPLADGTSSIVWSADDAIAGPLLASTPEEFARALNEASDSALGETRLLGERLSFPLRKLAAERYVTQRCALVGDAAHVVHPLAGQGVNLGLLDAAALAQLLIEARSEREDPGALRVLRRYERARKSEIAIMRTAIDAFDRFLAHGSGPISRLAQRGLGWVNRSQEVKRFFIRRALGLRLN